MIFVAISNVFLQKFSHYTDKLESFETECDDLFSHFQQRNLEALIHSVRSTLDGLRRRITWSSGLTAARRHLIDESSYPPSVFLTQLVLSLPTICLKPSLEEVQNAVNTAVSYVAEIGSAVPLWTPIHPQSNQSTPRSATSSQSEPACIE